MIKKDNVTKIFLIIDNFHFFDNNYLNTLKLLLSYIFFFLITSLKVNIVVTSLTNPLWISCGGEVKK